LALVMSLSAVYVLPLESETLMAPVIVPARMVTRTTSVFPAATPLAGTVITFVALPQEAVPTVLTKAGPEPGTGVLVTVGVEVGVFVGPPGVLVAVGVTGVFVRVGVAVGPGVFVGAGLPLQAAVLLVSWKPMSKAPPCGAALP